MRRWLVRLGVLAALVVLVTALRWTVFRPDPIAVTATEIGRGTVEETVTNSRAGTVQARRRAKLSPEVGGLVVATPHREGSRVTAGEVLLQLDDDLQRAELELARRALSAAEAMRDQACLESERAVRERDRLARLAADDIVSEDLLDEATTRAESYAAACTAARAEVERSAGAVALARTQLDRTLLRAPFDGIVADLWIEVGEWATPAPPAVPVPPVLDLIDPSSIYISAPMDEVDAGVLHPDLPVRLTVDSHPGRVFDGRIARVAPYVEDAEEQNRTVEIEVEPTDQGLASSLLPGTSADVEVILETRTDVLRVPTLALVEGDRIFLIGPEGTIVDREVELGLSNWDWTEIVSGVDGGERVVTSLDRAGVEAGAVVTVE
ncbi:MAG: efflux RND transporter periplasmic adaptor subunit [Acidobacteriota bacterium]|jgi:HlyD family secretion protein